MTVLNKIKWVLGISLVFLLVLTTNLVDRQNFRVMKDSLQAIYDDRLVAQDILFEISRVVWNKETAYASGASTVALREESSTIDQAIERFAATTLTPQEEEIFSQLQSSLSNLEVREAAFASGEGSMGAVMEAFDRAKRDLIDLSAIQMREGRRHLFSGKEAVSSSEFFTQLEIGALIVLALSVQVIILYSPIQRRELTE